MLGAGWDWSGAAAAKQRLANGEACGGVGGAAEDVREAGDLQCAYHSLLHGVGMNGLLAAMQQSPDALALAMDAMIQVCRPMLPF